MELSVTRSRPTPAWFWNSFTVFMGFFAITEFLSQSVIVISSFVYALARGYSSVVALL